MSKKYDDYLKTKEWNALRQDCFKRFGDCCMGCGSHRNIQAHHVFYPRVIQETKVDHLMSLCAECHKAVHCSEERASCYREEFADSMRNSLAKRLRALRGPTYFDQESDRRRIEELKRRRADHHHIAAVERRIAKGVANPLLSKASRKAIRKAEQIAAHERRQDARMARNAVSQSTELRRFTAFPT